VTADERRGVLLMTYGSPASLAREDIRAYLARVRGGREPDPGLVDEFARRYRVIGGSPLVEITKTQARELEDRFDGDVLVRAAVRFSEPSIERALGELTDLGARRVLGIIMSPQYSPLLMGGYQRDVSAARASLLDRAPSVEIAGAWHREPAFLDAIAERIRQGLERFAGEERTSMPVLLTAHSLPRRVADQEPDYLAQLRETAESVAERAGLERNRWTFCWQSAGHEPGEWMKPDFADLMPTLRAEGHRSVLVAPVQFLADHLEILYDIDVGARQQAEAAGLRFDRIKSLNMSPQFIDALAAVVARHIEAAGPVDAQPAAR
jgi:protoporphyrin/coproporphyrin ferrochelatase